MFNALSAAKFVVSGIVGIGTGKIVGSIIKNNVPTPETLIDKVTITGAAWVIGGIATKATKSYTNETIDEAYSAVRQIFTGLKESAALERIRRGESTFEKEGLDSAKYKMGDNGKYSKISDDEIVVPTVG